MPTKLKQHLAIATGAVSAAAIPMGADAAIVYKDSANAFTVDFTTNKSVDWDVDGAGGVDFRVETYVRYSDKIYIKSSGPKGGGFVGQVAGGDNFFNMAAGKRIASIMSAPYVWGNSLTNREIYNDDSNAPVGGDLINGQAGSNFVGFRFGSGADTLYGWAEVVIGTRQSTINRWAYNDTPDGSIEVGQTQDAPTPAPAPSTLALLAAGAFGLRRWRAQRAAA